MANVLCIGPPDAVTKTRCVLLEWTGGHEVTEAHNIAEVIAASKLKNFSVAVLSHSIPVKEKRSMLDALRRQNPAARILELHMTLAPELPDADGHLPITLTRPENLVEAVESLVKRNTKGTPHRAPSNPQREEKC